MKMITALHITFGMKASDITENNSNAYQQFDAYTIMMNLVLYDFLDLTKVV